jgi:hypothetical protein
VSCPKPVELSRALIAGIDDRLRAHLDICTRCSEQLDAHATVAAETRQLPIVEPTHDHAFNVRASLMVAARTSAPVGRSRFIWGFATAGAFAAAAVLAFVFVRGPQSSTETTASYRGTLLPHEGAALLRVASAPDEIVRLTHGTLSVEVAKLERGERFRVVTGDAEVEVRGTAFDVTVDRDHLRSVRVLHGRVEIRAYGSTPQILEAGERWDTQLAAAPIGEPSAEAIVATTDDVVAQPTAPATRVMPPAADKRVTPSAPKRVTTKNASSARTIEAAKPAAEPEPAAQAVTTKQTIVQAPARAKRPIELLFEEGWATLAAGDAIAAAAIFERAAQSAPQDPLAEDAWFWRASALARAKSAAAPGALDSFLSRYARSPRVGEASAMLGWLIMDRDLDRAEKLFHAAENDRVVAVRASASKGLAAIAQRRRKAD